MFGLLDPKCVYLMHHNAPNNILKLAPKSESLTYSE